MVVLNGIPNRLLKNCATDVRVYADNYPQDQTIYLAQCYTYIYTDFI